MTPISTQGTAFQAVSTREVNYSKDELKSEEINVNKDTNTSNLVAFKDFKSGETITVTLSETNLSKLKDNFSEDNFFMRDDGITRLSGKAESFVSGWYQDIAYNREFLKADKNSDGILDDGEYKNTRNEYGAKGMLTVALYRDSGYTEIEDIHTSVEKNYIKVGEHITNTSLRYNHKYEQPKSIEDELNTTIRIDKDLNGEVSLNETFRSDIKKDNMSDKEAQIANVEDDLIHQPSMVKRAFHNTFTKGGNGIDRAIGKFLVSKDELEKEESEMSLIQQATQKLIASNGNEAVLSQEEREAISAEISTIKARVREDILNEPLLDVKV